MRDRSVPDLGRRLAPDLDRGRALSPGVGHADIEFEQWRRANMDFVVVGLVAIVHDDGHEIEFRLVDTRAQKPVVEFVVPSAPGGLRDTAQKIAGIIDRRLTTSTQATRRP